MVLMCAPQSSWNDWLIHGYILAGWVVCTEWIDPSKWQLDMCCDETMNKGLSSSVGKAEEQHLLWSLLHYAKYPRIFRYSPSLILCLGNFDSSISTFFSKPPSLIPAFRTLLEQIVLSSPSARTRIGFERLVSRSILLPEICIAQRNVRCSQELNVILDPSKKNLDLIESHGRHRSFAQHQMYPSFTRVVSRTGGSVSWALGFYVGGCEFYSGRTNTQGLKITE